MKKFFFGLCAALLLFSLNGCKPKYESVPNDPLNARIYTLDNGLKVYMSVNKDEPRIQTYIAVRAGGKNDPAETTGLAHYFEHLMFKGTKQFGTVDYEKEEPMLNEIEQLFEVYRTKTDPEERKAIYHQIDSISYEASKLFIPNEYDKLMAAIGASGTNAYTSYDMTVYTEDIPSNQIENWAKIQADRFKNNVIRGFHTELETIYEEKNMSLTRDDRKVTEKMLSLLFPNHPYGRQTILGSQDHLKNPSISNIKKYYATYYVPNNMAICLSGDFDPDEMLSVIEKYFGDMQPTDGVPALEFQPEEPMTQPIESDVYGLESEYVMLSWRMPGKKSPDYNMLTMIDLILKNGNAGLIDLDVNQQQKILYGDCGMFDLADYSAYLLMGYPKQGQTLEEVRDILLAEVEKLKAGDFDDYLLEANLNNYRLRQMRLLEANGNRADMFVDAFINQLDWADVVTRLNQLSEITKEDVVEFANEWFTEGYAVVNKREGADPDSKKIAKPEITPILTNRDMSSDFLKEIQNSEVSPIEPVFVDFKKDLSQFTVDSKLPVVYVQNTSNEIFNLVYRFDMGTDNNKMLSMAMEYLDYLGTSELLAEQFKQEMYKLACSYFVTASDDFTAITLTGLSENMPKAMALVESLFADPQINEEAFNNFIQDELKARVMAKTNQSHIFSLMRSYLYYGPKSSSTNVLSNAELMQLTPDDFLKIIKEQMSYKHRVLYYGPLSQSELSDVLEECHPLSGDLLDVPAKTEFPILKTTENKVYLAQYDAKQLYYASASNLEEMFDVNIEPIRMMFNEYFGGGMNAIVFQEMREARGLAYSASAGYSTFGEKDRPYTMTSYIATQNDKMRDAMEAFADIINNMPESETAFKLAKDGLDARLRTDRTIHAQILNKFLSMEKYGLDYDLSSLIFEKIQTMTLDDVKQFQQSVIKGRPYSYAILGDIEDLDLDYLKTIGDIEILDLETVFGY